MPKTPRPNRAPHERRRPTAPSMGQRRLRAALLLVAFLWVPTSITLAAMHVLTWLSVPFAVLTVAAVLVWLRTEVATDRSRRADAGDSYDAVASTRLEPADDDTQAVHTHTYASVSGASEPATARESRTATTEAGAAAVSATAGSEPVLAARREIAAFFDGEAATAVANRVADRVGNPTARPATPAAEAQPLAPGTWSPVPVPRPTYSLKAKAEPRLTESGIPADVFATPEFADEADELDDRARFARRAASG